MTATTPTARTAAKAGDMPDAFIAEMTKLVRAGRAEATAAHFDAHGSAVLDHLSEPQRTELGALMEYDDTVIDLERVAGSQRGQPAATEVTAPSTSR
jgi:hypothetical protein